MRRLPFLRVIIHGNLLVYKSDDPDITDMIIYLLFRPEAIKSCIRLSVWREKEIDQRLRPSTLHITLSIRERERDFTRLDVFFYGLNLRFQLLLFKSDIWSFRLKICKKKKKSRERERERFPSKTGSIGIGIGIWSEWKKRGIDHIPFIWERKFFMFCK